MILQYKIEKNKNKCGIFLIYSNQYRSAHNAFAYLQVRDKQLEHLMQRVIELEATTAAINFTSLRQISGTFEAEDSEKRKPRRGIDLSTKPNEVPDKNDEKVQNLELKNERKRRPTDSEYGPYVSRIPSFVKQRIRSRYMFPAKTSSSVPWIRMKRIFWRKKRRIDAPRRVHSR